MVGMIHGHLHDGYNSVTTELLINAMVKDIGTNITDSGGDGGGEDDEAIVCQRESWRAGLGHAPMVASLEEYEDHMVNCARSSSTSNRSGGSILSGANALKVVSLKN